MDRERLEEQFSDQYRVNDKRINANLMEYSFRLGEDGVGNFINKRIVCEGAASCEFPAVNSAFEPEKQRRYIWTNALSDPSGEWLDGIQKIDCQLELASTVKTFGPGTFAGPPIFVPRQSTGMDTDDEQNGYIITAVYVSKEHRSDFVVLDASSLELLCRIELTQNLPFGFHGEYLADYVS